MCTASISCRCVKCILNTLHDYLLKQLNFFLNAHSQVLFPPEETHKLLDRAGCELAADITPGMYDPIEYPLLASATRYEVLQAPGEALYVPSGWHHQVTLSITIVFARNAVCHVVCTAS
jgi:Cupin-like domain